MFLGVVDGWWGEAKVAIMAGMKGLGGQICGWRGTKIS